MTGLRTRAGRAIGRSSVGALSLAVALLMAPTAAATPDSDAAETAISHAWDTNGGDGGVLGAKDGDVYQVADGYAQNFAGGKIYFTANAGAHPIYGAILDKYQALGGPTDSDLGFPTIDEGAGKAPDSRNSTFSAADKPVIFWTPDNGAWVVRGAINAAWDKLGGSAGALGVPTADESWQGDVVSQNFTGGEVSWDVKTKEFNTTPADLAGQLTGLNVPGDATTAIAAARRAYGGPLGPLGAEQGAQYKVDDAAKPDAGVAQNYAGGTIFYSPDTGAHVVTGPLLAKYQAVGGPKSDLGFPTGSEADGGLSPSSRVVTFAAADKPEIFWTPDHGAVVVRGAMNAAWGKLGGATGKLGAPTGDQSVSGDVVSQKFTGGSISWNKSSHAFSTDPADLAAQLTDLQVPSMDLPNAANAAPSAAGKWYQFHWWWLLAIVPLALVVAAIVIASLLRRRRRASAAEPDDLGHDDYGDYGDSQYADDEHAEHYAQLGEPAAGEHGEHPDDEWHGSWDDEHAEHGPEAGYPEEFSSEEHAPHEVPAFQANPDVIDTAPNVFPDLTAEHPADQPVEKQVEKQVDEGQPAAEPLEAPAEGSHGAPADEATASVELPDALRRGAAPNAPQKPDSEAARGDRPAGLGGAALGAAGLGAAGVAGLAAWRHRDADQHNVPAPEADADTAVSELEPPAGPESSAVAEGPAGESAEPPASHPEPESEPSAADVQSEDQLPTGPPSGRHHALGAEEPETAQMSFRVATGAPPPHGYDIKADTKTGLYWVPGSPGYDTAPVEIWFASEEFAVTNGFIRG
ncbi:MAG: hypothetical protein P4L86_18615 [Mycobacterium sp.]|nr:hypothetical protein [Mycobacterium sp.]